MKKSAAKRLPLFAALVLGLPVTAAAQFAMDTEAPALRRAMHRTALADLAEGNSMLVTGPLPACTKDQALFVANTPLGADFPQAGENYRILRLPGNALAIETVTTDEQFSPRPKMAVGLALSASESDCARLLLPDNRLLRIATLDGATSASALLSRMGALEIAEQETTQSPAIGGPSAMPTDLPHGWRISEEAAKGGVHVALVATLDPRPVGAGGEDPAAPRLKMRCENDSISFFISSDTVTWDERAEITLRIGDGKVSTYRWRTSEDGKGVGLWNTAEAIAFIRKLPDNAGFLRLRDRNLIYAEFDLANLGESLKRIEEACK